MVAIRKKGLKVFTFVVLLVFLTSFFLNYAHTTTAYTWFPKQMVMHFSEHFKRFMKYPERPCSCSQCISETGFVPWFDERFNHTMQPLLNAQNAFLENDTYQWWMVSNADRYGELQKYQCPLNLKIREIVNQEKLEETLKINMSSIFILDRLQRERLPRRLNDTFKDLFRIVPSDTDPLLEKGPLICRRCAVVGNSGNLKQSQYGRDIDSHDFVLRMNRAPTAGFEADVGRKTTHHLVYPESFRDLAENVSMILIPFKIMDLQWVISALTKGTINFTYVPVPRKIQVKREKILIYHPAFIKYVFDSWLQGHGRYPSTGILSVILSLHICDEVDLYGFGADSKGNWHHYWENNPSAGAFRKTGVHDGDYESNVTSILASFDKIRIFKGR